MTQTIRHTFRFINLFVVAGAFFLIDETRLTQVVMGMSFLFLAQIEAGLFLWEGGSKGTGEAFRQWMLHGAHQGTGRHSESGLGSAFILLIWVTLGLGLIA